MRAAATALLRHVGRRGAFLLFLTLLDAVLAYSLSAPLPFGLSRSTVYQPFAAIMPLPWWAWWWLLTAVATALAAFIHRLRVYTFGAASLIKATWSVGYFYGWLSDLPAYTRGYQTGAVFAAFAAIVVLVSGWRENGQ